MFNAIKRLFGAAVKTDFAGLVREGALIIDVRTAEEFKRGHIKNSLNIPLDQVKNIPGKLKDRNRVIITCCASGIRSASAKALLKTQGYPSVYNGGSWNKLESKL